MIDKTTLIAAFDRWCKKLRLTPAWSIKLEFVEDRDWHKTGDFKVDCDDRNAILLLNLANPQKKTSKK